jgi:UDP-galactopyranose mutase
MKQNYFSNFDAIIVGTGFSGSIIARKLADENKKILILEKRSHIAGNMYDERDKNGILVQRYGPHTIYTDSDKVFNFVKKYTNNKITNFYLNQFSHLGKFDGEEISISFPLNFDAVDKLSSNPEKLKTYLSHKFGQDNRVLLSSVLDDKDELCIEFTQKLFNLNIKPYMKKCWDMKPNELDISVMNNHAFIIGYSEDVYNKKYTLEPTDGYESLFKNIINSDNIELSLNTDAKNYVSVKDNTIFIKGVPYFGIVIWTGPIDYLFDYKFGKLPYRSRIFEYETLPVESYLKGDCDSFPNPEVKYHRITEYTKLPPQPLKGKTVIAKEYAIDMDETKGYEPYYPVPTEDNINTYEKYKAMAEKIPNLYCIGRLANYKYFTMSDTILNAFEYWDIIKKTQ